MDIIKRLKKEKKAESIFDELIKNKDNEKKDSTTPADVEVTQLTPDKSPVDQGKPVAPAEKPVKREFHAEGMHEFDIESLGTSAHMSAKLEYKARISIAIDEGKFEEAIELIRELQQKIAQG